MAEGQCHHVPLSLRVWEQPGMSTACSPLWSFHCQSSTKASGPNKKILWPFSPQSFAQFELQPPQVLLQNLPACTSHGTRAAEVTGGCHQPGSAGSGTICRHLPRCRNRPNFPPTPGKAGLVTRSRQSLPTGDNTTSNIFPFVVDSTNLFDL